MPKVRTVGAINYLGMARNPKKNQSRPKPKPGKVSSGCRRDDGNISLVSIIFTEYLQVKAKASGSAEMETDGAPSTSAPTVETRNN